MAVGAFYAILSQEDRIVVHFVDPAVRFVSLPLNIKACPGVCPCQRRFGMGAVAGNI